MAVRRSLNNWLTSRPTRKDLGLPFQWGGGELIVAVVLIVGILILGSGMFGSWINSAAGDGLLPVSMHSLGEADYGVDEISRPVPAIGLEIIQDLLGIDEPPETGGLPGIALITPREPSPTPRSTLPIIGDVPGTATPTEDNVISATATPGAVRSPTPFQTVQATPTPTWTLSPPSTPIPTSTPGKSATNTPLPTSTPGISATNTPLPTQIIPTATVPIPATSTALPSPVPPPTNPPNPSPTPPPDTPAMARPTRSSTLAVTPTAQYTPAVTAGTPSLP
jgi:hypothetical protein